MIKEKKNGKRLANLHCPVQKPKHSIKYNVIQHNSIDFMGSVIYSLISEEIKYARHTNYYYFGTFSAFCNDVLSHKLI